MAEIQDARAHGTSEIKTAHHWTARPLGGVGGGGPLGLQHQEDASGGSRFTRGIDRLQNTSPWKSAAWQLAGHGGPSQRCVERHQMVCYETQFGQKIAGAFWFLGGQQSSREGGRGLCEVGGTDSSFGIRPGFHFQRHPPTCTASVSLSVKWMKNILPQPSARLWYRSRNWRGAGRRWGTHRDTQTKQKSRPSFVRWGATEAIPTAAVGLEV